MLCPSYSILVLLVGMQLHCKASGYLAIPGLPTKQYVQQGDVMFGSVINVYDDKGPGQCSDTLSTLDGVYFAELIKRVVDDDNERFKAYRKFIIGFVILDGCMDDTIATSQSLAFLPQAKCSVPVSDANVQQNYHVEAVIGGLSSSQSIAVSHVLGPAQVPLINFLHTSDILEDKDQFPYFMRTPVIQDREQFSAMCSFIHLQGWTYVSVIYKAGGYGEEGYTLLKGCLEQKNICIALAHKASKKTTEEENRHIAQRLLSEYYDARVVVLISDFDALKLIRIVANNQSSGHFIWIFSDAIGYTDYIKTEAREHLRGSFIVHPIFHWHPSKNFDRYFRALKLRETKNPWFEDYWQELFNCSLSGGTCDPDLRVGDRLTHTTSQAILVETAAQIVMDAINDVKGSCCWGPGITTEEVLACITGPRMLEAMKQSKSGYSYLDGKDRYYVTQLIPKGRKGWLDLLLLAWYTPRRELEFYRNVTWQFHDTEVDDNGSSIPQSRCSRACGPQQATVVQVPVCCWICQACQPNERLVPSPRGGTQCQPCPGLTWSEEATAYTTCATIQPNRVAITSPSGALQAFLALVGLLASVLVFVLFYRHRHFGVIKASSWELSLLMLLGIGLGFLVMLTMLAQPTASTCQFNYVLYCTAFMLLYGPLFLRTLRIFRIIYASKVSPKLPRTISSNRQLGLCFGLVFIQVAVCTVVAMAEPEWRRMSQLGLVTCHFPQNALIPFLVYVLLLLCACALLAFKTWRLPDNFHECRFIAACVGATLVIVFCFVPAYIASSSEMRVLALGSALTCSVALLVLFLPKLYAVYCVGQLEAEPRCSPPPAGPSTSRVVVVSPRRLPSVTAPRTVVPPSAPKPSLDPQNGLDE